MASASGGGSGGGGGGSASVGGLEDAEIEMIKKSPAFWAKLGHHPYWPAKVKGRKELQGWLVWVNWLLD
jgi:hypothetical protein